MQEPGPIDYERSPLSANRPADEYRITRPASGLFCWEALQALMFCGFIVGLTWLAEQSLMPPFSDTRDGKWALLLSLLGIVCCLWRLALLLDYTARIDVLLVTAKSMELISRGPLGKRVRQWPRDQIADILRYGGSDTDYPSLLIVRTDGRREQLLRESNTRKGWQLLIELKAALNLPPVPGTPPTSRYRPKQS